MNNELFRWLFNVQVIPEDAEFVRLIWERPLPPWLWALLLILAGVFAIWSYSQLSGNRFGRGTLAALRLVIILLALVLISGPMLEMPRETLERDWVIMLVDRSASMQIEDVEDNAGMARFSRDAQLKRLLVQHNETWLELDEDRELIWLGFHIGAFALDPPPTLASSPLEPETDSQLLRWLTRADGHATLISTSLEQALQRAAARPLSGVVLFSDGRTTDPPTRSVLRRLQQDAVPVYVVPLGSPDPLAELAIRRVDAPRRAFVGDKVPIIVRIDRVGEAARDLGGTARLIDQDTGEELASERIEPGDERDEITLTVEPELAGDATWRVEIDTERPTLVPEQTVASFPIELVDDPLRVLYVEGYPRWEYRYVKNLLVREQSIDSSIMLLSADREFAQEGDRPIRRLPQSPGEFADYDVIILGDVPASYFTSSQLEMMRDHIADRGGGLLWISGERAMPNTFAGTVLADLLPMRGSLNLSSVARPVLMEPTPLAERLGVLQLSTPDEIGWPRELRDPGYGWSQLRFAHRIDPERLKPAVEVLARTTDHYPPEPLPLVMMMRYGAGKSVYVATDEIWRWRYGRGELLPEQFWVQIIRMLGRETLMASDDRATLAASPRRVQMQQPVRLELRLLDAQLVEQAAERLSVDIRDSAGEAVSTLDLSREGDAGDRFTATFLPDFAGGPGRYRAVLADPSLSELRLDADIELFAPDDELRRPETDHDLLAELAEATGGDVLAGDELATLPARLPNRAITTVNPLTERIWDTPFFFMLLVLLLTLEWVGRKVMRLI